MLIYETNLANTDPAKAARATLRSPILYICFLKMIRYFDSFISAGIRSSIFAPNNRFAAKMKIIATSKFIGRIYAKLKNIVHDNRRERAFLTL